ncbi:hypothetical protein C0995_007205 [Termitomyces sp. Mi166|nr:hypothetical protein C0995_007205 [Termitomyces sp. Mi166\
MGTAEPSVAEYIAECQRILQKSGLTYKAIHDCHAAVHAQGAPRVATDIRIGTRVDRDLSSGGGNDAKVKRVQEILAKEHVI